MTLLWSYVWKTSDGKRHKDSVLASSREDAFSILRQKGIRPIKVEQVLRPIDRIISLCKHVSFFLLVALAISSISYFVGRKSKSPPPTDPGILKGSPLPRQQIDLSRIDVHAVFKFRSEMYLARFASPGILSPTAEELPDDISTALKVPLQTAATDSIEVQKLKRIVSGMKNEIAHLITAGKTLEEISEWLLIRQQMECDFRKQLIAGREKDPKAKDAINVKLRSLGLKEIE